MEYEVDYLDKFLKAMKEWKIPCSEDDEKRERIENSIKDSFVSDRSIKTKRITDVDDVTFGKGVLLSCFFGETYENLLFIEHVEEDQTQLWWVLLSFSGRVDEFLLREIDGRPYQLIEILNKKRQESYKESDLW